MQLSNSVLLKARLGGKPVGRAYYNQSVVEGKDVQVGDQIGGGTVYWIPGGTNTCWVFFALGTSYGLVDSPSPPYTRYFPSDFFKGYAKINTDTMASYPGTWPLRDLVSSTTINGYNDWAIPARDDYYAINDVAPISTFAIGNRQQISSPSGDAGLDVTIWRYWDVANQTDSTRLLSDGGFSGNIIVREHTLS